MKLYHLYVSGILYAELDFDTQPISIQKPDIASGKLLPWETLSEEDNAFYKSFTKIDLLKLSHQLHSYEQKLVGDGEVIVELPEGAERSVREDMKSGTCRLYYEASIYWEPKIQK